MSAFAAPWAAPTTARRRWRTPPSSTTAASNNTRYGGGLRLSHQLTPIVTAFADGSVEYRTYDAVSPTLLVKLDSTDYVGKVGLSAEIGTILEAEGSVGVGLRQFADASLADVQAMLYEASVTFRPDETLEFIGTIASRSRRRARTARAPPASSVTRRRARPATRSTPGGRSGLPPAGAHRPRSA